MSSMRDSSRANWLGNGSIDHINAGSLQRIADATEKMAAGYDSMRNDRDRYKRLYEDERAIRQKRDRQIASLRGVITRLKRAAK